MILIDTQALIWFGFGDPRLGKKASARLVQAIADKDAAMSPISFWEAAMLVRKGRIALGVSTRDWADALLRIGVQVVGLTADIAITAGELPDQIPGDPADRLIVATAQRVGCPLMTADRNILRYAATGHVQAIDARL